MLTVRYFTVLVGLVLVAGAGAVYGQGSCSCGVDVCVDITNTSGTEDGSCASPYNTIAEGVAAASAGGSVHVASGTYTESGIVLNKDLTVKGEPLAMTATAYTTIVTDPFAPPESGGGAQATFIFESVNSNTTIQDMTIENSPNATAFGSDNSSTSTNTTMTIRRVFIEGLLRGLMLNDIGLQRGNLVVDYVTVKNCTTGVGTNDGKDVTVTNSIFADNFFGLRRHNTATFTYDYTLFDNNTNDAVAQVTGPPPTEGTGNKWGASATCSPHTCASCARDMADPTDPFSNEPAPNGGRADVGAYGNTVLAPAGCGSLPSCSNVGAGGGGSPAAVPTMGSWGIAVLVLLIVMSAYTILRMRTQ